MIALIMRLTGLSRVVTIAALAVALVALLGVVKCTYDRNLIRNHEKDTTIRVQATASAAADNAREAADQSRFDTEKSNDDARKAAAGADDPLKSGLDSLRGKSAPKPPAR